MESFNQLVPQDEVRSGQVEVAAECAVSPEEIQELVVYMQANPQEALELLRKIRAKKEVQTIPVLTLEKAQKAPIGSISVHDHPPESVAEFSKEAAVVAKIIGDMFEIEGIEQFAPVFKLIVESMQRNKDAVIHREELTREKQVEMVGRGMTVTPDGVLELKAGEVFAEFASINEELQRDPKNLDAFAARVGEWSKKLYFFLKSQAFLNDPDNIADQAGPFMDALREFNVRHNAEVNVNVERWVADKRRINQEPASAEIQEFRSRYDRSEAAFTEGGDLAYQFAEAYSAFLKKQGIPVSFFSLVRNTPFNMATMVADETRSGANFRVEDPTSLLGISKRADGREKVVYFAHTITS